MTSDLTPLLRANDRLEHALLSTWLGISGVGLCVVDSDAVVVMLNPAACVLLGVNGSAMLNQPFQSLVAAVKFQPGIVRWLAIPGFNGSRHASIARGAGEIDLLFNASDLRADMVQSAGVSSPVSFKVIAITDVTELLEAQRQVNSESFRRQWQALNAGVVISDARLPDMPIVYVNPMFETMCGYKSDEVLGRNCRFLQGVEANQPGLAAIRAAIASQSNGYAKLRNFRKDGSLFVNELFISPVKDAGGVVTHFVGIQHLESNGAT